MHTILTIIMLEDDRLYKKFLFASNLKEIVQIKAYGSLKIIFPKTLDSLMVG